jgi:solute carrier family 13 (sodium-dependent dicarboxylate transporter), member 2/3/5
MSNKTLKQSGLILGPLLFTLTVLFFHPEGLSKEANAVLATTLWVAVWWILEVIPIAVTSLLPIILFPITGALKISETLKLNSINSYYPHLEDPQSLHAKQPS